MFYVRDALESAAAMKAVVMAGGEGTRLRPLTSNQPKPMVPIVGKPCMEHIIELLKEHGFEDVIVTVAFLPQAIRSYFGGGETLGVDVSYSVEESPLGTAGSVRLAAGRLDDTFLVISGDALCDVDLTKLVEFHREKKRVGDDRPQVGREPARVRDRRHRRGRPHRALPREAVVGPGLLATRSTRASTCSSRRCCATSRRTGPFDFSKELFPLLLEMGRPMYGYVMDGYWQDIGNLDQYRQANFDALDEKVRLNIPGIRIRGNVWVGEGVDLHDLDAIEGPAFLGNYCRIAPDATVGPYTRARDERDAARARADLALDRRRARRRSGARPRSRARSSGARATSARTCACTRASRSATR